MVETNTFHPAAVAQSIQPSALPDPVTTTQYAQERFLAISTGQANPAFRLAADRNRLAENGGPISRGYIRRSNIDTGDPTSSYRLYFMFNPETIQRSYIAYLDQQALDPGNALYGSNNMASAPGILDFSFNLLFDRQLEVASDPTNPGTKVDYDYFDIVVRGVVPDSNSDGNSIPDNGIMMVNPNSLVVVFGQDLSVQGRVTNAGVVFSKFNNAMIPTRLQISLAMKALYIGPVQTIPNYSLFTTESAATATIPYEDTAGVSISFEDIKYAKANIVASPTSGFANNGGDGLGQGTKPVNGTTDETSFAHNLLIYLSVPDTDPNVQAIIAWERAEGGMPWNNPLNTTEKMPGATYGPGGIGHYVSLDQAVQATAKTLTDGQYNNVLDALRKGISTCEVLYAADHSPWRSGRAGGDGTDGYQKVAGCK